MKALFFVLLQVFAAVSFAEEVEQYQSAFALDQIFTEIVERQASSAWKMTAADDTVLQTPACLASTASAKVTPAMPVELVVSFPKDANLLPVIYVKITGISRSAKWALIKFGAKEFQPMFLLQAAATNADPDIYWYAPKDLTKLIALIKANNTLDIAFDVKAATPVPVQFSLAGSTDAINKAVSCAKYNMTPADLFLKFMNEKVAITNPATGVAIDGIQALTQKSFGEYLKGRKVADSLTALRKAMKPLTDKESVAAKDFNTKQAEVDKISTDLATTEADIIKMENEVSDMTAALPNLDSQLTAAKTDLAAKKIPYDQGKSQLTNVEKVLASKQADLKKANDAVDKAESIVAADTAMIANLEARNRSLRSRIGQINGELPSAKRDVDDAHSEYQRYDERRERDSYLTSRTWYDSYVRDLDSKRRDLSSAQRDVGYAQGEVSSARSSLDSCKRTPNANCSSEESRLSSAESSLWSAQSREQSLESDISGLESRIRDCEAEADRHARAIADDLYSKYTSASNYYDGLVNEKASAQSEIRNNETKRIPALQDEITRTNAALPGLKAAVDTAKVAVTDAQNRLAAERARIGFDVIEKAYVDAQTLVKQLSEQIANYKATIAKNKTQLPKSKANVTKLKAALAKAIPARDTAQTKLTGIQTQLGPQRQQEADLMREVDASTTLLKGYRDLYLGEVAKNSEGL